MLGVYQTERGILQKVPANRTFFEHKAVRKPENRLKNEQSRAAGKVASKLMFFEMRLDLCCYVVMTTC